MAEKTTKLPSKSPTKPANNQVQADKAKKAVIATGGKQYLVSVGDELEVDLLKPAKNATFDVLMVIDGDNTTVGQPLVEGVRVSADITEQLVKGEKVTAIRYKSKKRVRKVRGHRQRHTRIKITKIA